MCWWLRDAECGPGNPGGGQADQRTVYLFYINNCNFRGIDDFRLALIDGRIRIGDSGGWARNYVLASNNACDFDFINVEQPCEL